MTPAELAAQIASISVVGERGYFVNDRDGVVAFIEAAFAEVRARAIEEAKWVAADACPVDTQGQKNGSRMQRYFTICRIRALSPVAERPEVVTTPDKLPTSKLTNSEIVSEFERVSKLWDDLFNDSDFEGHSGSPGEWMMERLNELETEQNKRAALKLAGDT